ncbi:MAG: SDR family NAD(P)-dependent oxidoreductase [Acidobacteriota bacterium]
MSERPCYALIGATGGIGRALAHRLSARGAGLLLGARTEDRLDALRGELGATSGEAPLSAAVDARDFDAVSDFLKRAKELPGPLRGVVNLAGSSFIRPAHRTSAEQYEDVIATNLTTAFATVRASAKALRKGGSVVLLASAVADIGLASHEALAAAKGGVAALARSAASTYASQGLRVNAIAPGLVETPMTAAITDNDIALKASLALHPLGRVGQAEEVASLIDWLLGDDASWVTGQVWGIDGGH